MCGLSCPVACGILFPQTGIKPASPELQGRFLTTRPAGKSRGCQILDLVRGSQTFFCKLYTQKIFSSLKTLKTFSMGDISNNICHNVARITVADGDTRAYDSDDSLVPCHQCIFTPELVRTHGVPRCLIVPPFAPMSSQWRKLPAQLTVQQETTGAKGKAHFGTIWTKEHGSV